MTRYAPNWFTVPMGTAIVAVVLEGLPGTVPGQSALAVGFWLLGAVLLLGVAGAALQGRRSDPLLWHRHHTDPVLGHFSGAAAMAILAVAAGTGLVGEHLLGATAAHTLAIAGWLAGTALGCWTAVAVPVTAIRTHTYAPSDPSGWWLLPVVPPLVSAATGAALVPWLPSGQVRQSLVVLCAACIGVSLIAGMLLLGQLWTRLLQSGMGPTAAVPTLWIPLGFLGQSVTAVHHLAAQIPAAFPAAGLPPAGLRALELAFCLPVWGFGLLWLAICVSLTRAARHDGLRFSLAWWAFTFPLATMVTATAALADLTGLDVLIGLAWAGGGTLVAIWGVVATGTARTILRTIPASDPRASLVDAA